MFVSMSVSSKPTNALFVSQAETTATFKAGTWCSKPLLTLDGKVLIINGNLTVNGQICIIP
jgi:hypothetical protein